MSRFVQPDTVTLPISNGDTLVVKQRLNEGERRAAFARLYQHVNGTGYHVNPQMMGIATVLAYLVDWSLRDDAGRPVTIAGTSEEDRQAVLDSLDPADFAEIRDAIDAHIEATAAARDAQKKTGGTPAPVATSPSVS